MNLDTRIANLEKIIQMVGTELSNLKSAIGFDPQATQDESFKKESKIIGPIFRYIRRPKHYPSSNLGGVTLAFVLDQRTGSYRVGAAICRTDENFDKEFGRQRAETRLNRCSKTIRIEYEMPSKEPLVDHFFKILKTNYKARHCFEWWWGRQFVSDLIKFYDENKVSGEF
jgi:hypothetical protein